MKINQQKIVQLFFLLNYVQTKYFDQSQTHDYQGYKKLDQQTLFNGPCDSNCDTSDVQIHVLPPIKFEIKDSDCGETYGIKCQNIQQKYVMKHLDGDEECQYDCDKVHPTTSADCEETNNSYPPKTKCEDCECLSNDDCDDYSSGLCFKCYGTTTHDTTPTAYPTYSTSHVIPSPTSSSETHYSSIAQPTSSVHYPTSSTHYPSSTTSSSTYHKPTPTSTHVYSSAKPYPTTSVVYSSYDSSSNVKPTTTYSHVPTSSDHDYTSSSSTSSKVVYTTHVPKVTSTFDYHSSIHPTTTYYHHTSSVPHPTSAKPTTTYVYQSTAAPKISSTHHEYSSSSVPPHTTTYHYQSSPTVTITASYYSSPSHTPSTTYEYYSSDAPKTTTTNDDYSIAHPTTTSTLEYHSSPPAHSTSTSYSVSTSVPHYPTTYHDYSSQPSPTASYSQYQSSPHPTYSYVDHSHELPSVTSTYEYQSSSPPKPATSYYHQPSSHPESSTTYVQHTPTVEYTPSSSAYYTVTPSPYVPTTSHVEPTPSPSAVYSTSSTSAYETPVIYQPPKDYKPEVHPAPTYTYSSVTTTQHYEPTTSAYHSSIVNEPQYPETSHAYYSSHVPQPHSEVVYYPTTTIPYHPTPVHYDQPIEYNTSQTSEYVATTSVYETSPEKSHPVSYSPEYQGQGECVLPLKVGIIRNKPVIVGDGKPSSCTQEALQHALSVGGYVQFNCGPSEHVILITKPLTFSSEIPTVLDGNSLIVLDGGKATSILQINSSVSNLTVKGIRFTRAKSAYELGGGAISVIGSSTLSLIQSTFDNNLCDLTNDNIYGGAIYAAKDATVQIQSCRFESNQCSHGGAIALQENSSLAIFSSEFEKNLAKNNVNSSKGGVIYSNSSKVILISCSKFLHNQAFQGGVLVSDNQPEKYSEIAVRSSSFYQNFVSSDDTKVHSIAGVFSIDGAKMNIKDSNFVDNTADAYPVISVKRTKESFMKSSIVAFNTAKVGNSGAIACDDQVEMDFESCLVYENSGPVGINFFNCPSLQVDHCIVYNSESPYPHCSKSLIDGGDNYYSPAAEGYKCNSDSSHVTEQSVSFDQDSFCFNFGPRYTEIPRCLPKHSSPQKL